MTTEAAAAAIALQARGQTAARESQAAPAQGGGPFTGVGHRCHRMDSRSS